MSDLTLPEKQKHVWPFFAGLIIGLILATVPALLIYDMQNTIIRKGIEVGSLEHHPKTGQIVPVVD